jgi:hypothetical protein
MTDSENADTTDSSDSTSEYFGTGPSEGTNYRFNEDGTMEKFDN